MARLSWFSIASVIAATAVAGCGGDDTLPNAGTTDGSTTGASGSTTTGAGGGGGQGGAAGVCGDGALDGTEECDDGNTTAGDGCDACSTEDGYQCSGEPSVCATLCGDGVLSGNEGCDDGDADSGDGCDAGCAVEVGYACAGAPSICLSVCGDGILLAGEVCDDSNTDAGDGCDAACLVEAGWTCDGTPSLCASICADGLVVGTEACDDDDTDAGDGCDPSCKVELGWSCAGEPSACTTGCGDGIVAGAEECDDSGLVDGDGCSAACVVEAGYTCSGAPSACGTVCGDGLVKGIEACDDGDLSPGDGCDAGCKVETGYTCAGEPSDCDPICGDGLVNGGEACDDQNLVGGDGCGATCAVEPGYACTGSPSTCNTVCGDGILKGTEVCDDGNLQSGDCCSASCTIEAGCELEPNGTVATANDFDTLSVNDEILGQIGAAGDKDIFSVTIPAVGISSMSATVQNGWSSTCAAGLDSEITIYDSASVVVANNDDFGGTCSYVSLANLAPGEYYVEVKATDNAPLLQFNYSLDLNVVTAICGNGTVETPEECDDSNTVSGDGCDSACVIEVPVVPSETEPNNTAATASGPFSPNIVIEGAIPVGSDVDFYAVTITTASDLKVETFDINGPVTCAGIDTLVELRAPDGTTILVGDDDDGVNNCSLINPAVAADAGARHLLPGTYYVRVASYNNSVIPGYTLQLTLTAVCGNAIVEGSEECEPGGAVPCDANCERVPVCGDGLIDGPEGCDDSNTTSGDGCSSTCVPEVCLAGQTAINVSSTDVPKSINDNSTVTSVISIPASGTIQSTVLQLNINHTYDGDLDISLASPGGPNLDISSDNGGTGENYTNTQFKSGGAPVCPPVTGGVAPFSGCYSPEASLAAFNGQSVTGTWTLTIADDAGGDTGQLTAWSLTVCVQ